MTRKVHSTLDIGRDNTESDLDPSKSKMRKCIHHIIVLFVFINDVIDLLSDWLFYADVSLQKSGLVYGPPSPLVIWIILFFSILGTFLFIMETVNLWYETKHDDPWLDSDILSAVVIWLEDVPQVAISLYLVLCREEAISVFQLVKAGVVLFSLIVRLILLGVKYFNPDAIKLTHHKKLRILIFIGVFMEALCSIAVFILTQTAPSSSGISFQVPDTLIEEKFNDRSYFANVSVFVNHEDFVDPNSWRAPPLRASRKHGPVMTWMRLASIDYVMARGKERSLRSEGHGLQYSIQFEIETASGKLKMATWEKQMDDNAMVTIMPWTMTGCYIVDRSNGNVTNVEETSKCTEKSGFFSTSSRNVYLTFIFSAPGSIFRQWVFGDIAFNMGTSKSSSSAPGASWDCEMVENYTSSIDTSSIKNTPLRLRYFRTASSLPPQGIKEMLHTTNGRDHTVRFFYNNGNDLEEIDTVWKTGWLGCASSGNLAPVLDKEIPVTCARDF